MAILIEDCGASLRPPHPHRNEFPAEYSLAGCSPAEPASAFPAGLILHNHIPFAKEISANGTCRIYSVSHKRAQRNIRWHSAAGAFLLLHAGRPGFESLRASMTQDVNQMWLNSRPSPGRPPELIP